MSAENTEKLLEILQEKIEWLTKMRDITEKCGIMLENDDVDAFLRSLEKREDIIGKIDACSQIELRLPISDDERVIRKKQAIRDLTADIIRMDDQNTAAAAEMLESYKKQLKNINEKRHGIGRYTNAYQQSEAYYFDEKK
jgi:hypothetical protein